MTHVFRNVIATVIGTVLVSQAVIAADRRVEFLEGDAGQRAIVDETMQPYFSLLSPLEIAAKIGEPAPGGTLKEQQSAARQQYQAAVMAFSEEEKAALRFFVEQLHPALAADYPKLATLPWQFIKLDSRIESGLPHTRGGAIVFSPRVLEMFTAIHVHMKQQPEDRARLAMPAFLLVHEQMHVLERKEPKLLEPLYAQWSFVHADAIGGAEQIEQRRITNPDAVDMGWVLVDRGDPGGPARPRYLWPQIVFVEGVEQPVMARDMRMIVVELEKEDAGFRVKRDPEGRPVVRPLTEDASYAAAVPAVRSAYHPAEIAADVVGQLVAAELLGDNADPAAGLRQKVRELLK